MDTVHIEGAT